MQLGRSPTVSVGDSVTRTAQRVTMSGCGSPFGSYQGGVVSNASAPLAPAATLSGPSSPVTLCQGFQIVIVTQANDGLRALQSFQWSLSATNATNLSAITALIAASGQGSTLTVPLLTLAENSSYTFMLTFQSYFGLSSFSTYSLVSGSLTGYTVTIQRTYSFLFRAAKENPIWAAVQRLSCLSALSVDYSQSLNVTWVDTSANAVLATYNSVNQSSLLYSVPPFSKPPGSTQYVRVDVRLAGSAAVVASDAIDYVVAVSPLLVYVVGGSRIQSYAAPLTVTGSATDPDVAAAAATTGVALAWNCVSLSTLLPCADVYGNLAVLNATSANNFVAKFFAPYSVLQFYLTATKAAAAKQNSDSAVIVIVETDIPQLQVTLPQNILQQQLNKNDEIAVQIADNGDPDAVFVTVALIYNYDTVATKSFRHTHFSLAVWDLFHNFQPSNNLLLLRISMYNPLFLMPSQVTYNRHPRDRHRPHDPVHDLRLRLLRHRPPALLPRRLLPRRKPKTQK